MCCASVVCVRVRDVYAAYNRRVASYIVPKAVSGLHAVEGEMVAVPTSNLEPIPVRWNSFLKMSCGHGKVCAHQASGEARMRGTVVKSRCQ